MDLHAVYDSLCWMIYTAKLQLLLTGWVLSKYYRVQEAVNTCMYRHVYKDMQVHTCMSLNRHVCITYMSVCTFLPDHVQVYRIPHDSLSPELDLYHSHLKP